jgi:cytochrome c biogenesis factor
VPLMVPLVLLIGIGPLARWKAARWSDIARPMWVTGGLATIFLWQWPFRSANGHRWLPVVSRLDCGASVPAWPRLSCACVAALPVFGPPG